MTPAQIIWQAHGSPVVDSCTPGSGRCFVCVGQVDRGELTDKWLKSSYTDQNRARSPTSLYVCEACCYVHSRTSPVLGRPAKEGKKFGGNFRNYSQLWEQGWMGTSYGETGKPGEYANASKGEKPLIREFLRREHRGAWFCGVADSGQKHTIPFIPMNGPGRGGRILFEETIVEVPESLALVDAMVHLLTAGCTKEEIELGGYTQRAWMTCPEAVQHFEKEHGHERGSPWFGLAVWLSQRDEEAVAERMATEKEARAQAKKKPAKEKASVKRTAKGTTSDTDSGGTARATKRVPKTAREHSGTEALGAAPEPSPVSNQDKRDTRGMGEHRVQAPADTRTGQLGLFGDS